MKKIAFTIVLFVSFNVQSQPLEKWASSLRPYFEKIIGEGWTDQLVGTEDKIKIPELPKITKDAKSTEVYKENSKSLEDNKKNRRSHQRFIREIVQATKLKKSNENDLVRWMNVLTQGGSREGVYRALVLDNSYAGLENYEQPANDSVIDFSKNFFNQFIGIQLSEKRAQSMNFYRLKRETVEKSLEMIDLLKTDREKLASWFAALSKNLADKYPKAFDSNSRLINKKLPHYNWALEAHEQRIKSEVIIKVHIVMNHLMGY